MRGALHGIPILLKDNYSTRDMPTSAASVALAGLRNDDDAFQVKRLRDAGAVILGKSNMHDSPRESRASVHWAGRRAIHRSRSESRGSSGGARCRGGEFLGGGVGLRYLRLHSYSVVGAQSVRLRPTKGLSSTNGSFRSRIGRDAVDRSRVLWGSRHRTRRDRRTRRCRFRDAPARRNRSRNSSMHSIRRSSVASSGRADVVFGEEAADHEGARVVRAAIDKMKARGAEVVDVAIPGLDSLVTAPASSISNSSTISSDFLATVPGPHVSSLSDILRLGCIRALDSHSDAATVSAHVTTPRIAKRSS